MRDGGIDCSTPSNRHRCSPLKKIQYVSGTASHGPTQKAEMVIYGEVYLAPMLAWLI